jgi:hypothetical protein
VGLRVDSRHLAGADHGQHSRCSARGGQVDPADAAARVRAAQDGGVQHPGQADVAREASFTAGLGEAVEARRVPADDVAGTGRPLDERVLVDERPDLLVAALDFRFGLDQPRQLEIASSMRG